MSNWEILASPNFLHLHYTINILVDFLSFLKILDNISHFHPNLLFIKHLDKNCKKYSNNYKMQQIVNILFYNVRVLPNANKEIVYKQHEIEEAHS